MSMKKAKYELFPNMPKWLKYTLLIFYVVFYLIVRLVCFISCSPMPTHNSSKSGTGNDHS